MEKKENVDLYSHSDNCPNFNPYPAICYDMIENIVGAGENAGYQHFLLFPKCFQKTFSYGSFNPLPNKPWFLCVCSASLLKTLWKKEKLLITSSFSFSHSVFYLCRELSALYIKFEIVVCKLFQYGRV